MCVYLSIEICTQRFHTCNVECGGWGGNAPRGARDVRLFIQHRYHCRTSGGSERWGVEDSAWVSGCALVLLFAQHRYYCRTATGQWKISGSAPPRTQELFFALGIAIWKAMMAPDGASTGARARFNSSRSNNGSVRNHGINQNNRNHSGNTIGAKHEHGTSSTNTSNGSAAGRASKSSGLLDRKPH